jgi:hypothetical protein
MYDNFSRAVVPYLKNIFSRKLLLFFSYFGLALLIIYLTYYSSINKVDAYWMKLDTLLVINGINNPANQIVVDEKSKLKYFIPEIRDSIKTLRAIYRKLQKDNPDCENFDDIIKKPFPLLDDYRSFTNFLNTFLEKKKLVLKGISGSGKSTLIDRVTRIITGDTNNVLKLECVARLEEDFHNEIVGFYDRRNFHPGKLLKFLEKAKSEPEHKFIFIVDDQDKIYPETLYGSILWKELDNSAYTSRLDGYPFEIYFPDNFYLLSVTHTDVGNLISFSSEQLRRLGDVYELGANTDVFLLYLRSVQKTNKFTYSHIKKILYFFEKSNNLIAEKYGVGFTLGHWSNLRKKIKPSEFQIFMNEFVSNVNAYKPPKEIKLKDFDDILYAIDNGGKVPNTNIIAGIYIAAVDTGIFSELSVAVGATVISALIGWWVIRKKKNLLII